MKGKIDNSSVVLNSWKQLRICQDYNKMEAKFLDFDIINKGGYTLIVKMEVTCIDEIGSGNEKEELVEKSFMPHPESKKRNGIILI